MRGRADAGLTLLEVIVVLAVIGIVSLVAAPAFPPPEREPSDVEVMRTLVRDAAATAARFDRPVWLAIDPTSGAWLVQLRLSDSVVQRRKLADGTSASVAVAGIQFRPDGRASGGPIVLHSGRASVTISVDPLTSRATVAF